VIVLKSASEEPIERFLAIAKALVAQTLRKTSARGGWGRATCVGGNAADRVKTKADVDAGGEKDGTTQSPHRRRKLLMQWQTPILDLHDLFQAWRTRTHIARKIYPHPPPDVEVLMVAARKSGAANRMVERIA